jgi:hypothetical protein
MATTLLLKTNNISTSGGYNINKIHWIEYEQHLIGYAIIRRISKILKKSLQHIFINNNPWILVQIHTFTLRSHSTVYDSKKSMKKYYPMTPYTY